VSIYTAKDARAIIRAYYGPDFGFRMTTGCTIGCRPSYQVDIGLPTLAWRKLATGPDSAVAIGELKTSGGIDWSWAAESRQLSK
jgi:hypothetical protein